MKILIISPFFFQQNNARAIQVRKLYGELRCISNNFYLATIPDVSSSLSRNMDYFVKLHKANNIEDKFYGGSVRSNARLLEAFIKEKRIDVILTITTPTYSAFIAYHLKRRFPSLKLVMYFSDPAPSTIYPNPYFTGYPSNAKRLQDFVKKLYLKKVLKSSDRIIVPSTNTIKYIERFYKLDLFYKTTIIPHFGGEAQNVPMKMNERLCNRLVYFGNLYKRLAPSIIEASIAAMKEFPDKFRGIVCYGTRHVKEFKELLQEYKVESVIKFYAPVDYNTSLKLMKQSHALLLIEADMVESPFMPSKFFDYLFSNRPILAVSPSNNSLSEHYKGDQNLYVVSHQSNEVYRAIRKIFLGKEFLIERKLDHLKPNHIIQQYLGVFSSLKKGN